MDAPPRAIDVADFLYDRLADEQAAACGMPVGWARGQILADVEMKLEMVARFRRRQQRPYRWDSHHGGRQAALREAIALFAVRYQEHPDWADVYAP